MNAVAFGERVMALLSQGAFTTSYKYAVLLGLMDLCIEQAGADGSAPTSVTTRQLAVKVLELYWPQVEDYDSKVKKPRQLRQVNDKTKQAGILESIHKFRAGSDFSRPLYRHQRDRTKGYLALVDDIEWTLVKWPLPRAQRIGKTEQRFIYEIDWDEKVGKRAFRSGDVANLVRFVPGAAESLTVLSGLLRPLIQREWAAQLAKYNRLPESDLEEFLFGASRVDLRPFAAPLVELQKGKCFYCGRALCRSAPVDHFVPWARFRNNDIANLVVADRDCNSNKSDYLAGQRHLERFLERLEEQRSAIDQIRSVVGPMSPDAELPNTLASTAAIYRRVPSGTALWDSGSRFAPADGQELQRLFASAS